MSEGKFSKCEEGEMFKYEISGVRKKNERKEKKKGLERRCLGGIFLLSSFSLVGLFVNLQVKVTEKKNGNFQSILRLNI